MNANLTFSQALAVVTETVDALRSAEAAGECTCDEPAWIVFYELFGTLRTLSFSTQPKMEYALNAVVERVSAQTTYAQCAEIAMAVAVQLAE